METKFTSVEKYGKAMEKIIGVPGHPKKMYNDYYQSGSEDQFTLSNFTKFYF